MHVPAKVAGRVKEHTFYMKGRTAKQRCLADEPLQLTEKISGRIVSHPTTAET
jgi:hypothetical protein